ncbi:hypothetical protein [Neorhodopirellula lusitana]|uniref:hypothetical protein n=1 Tax=Neorhodopirellula lusitana TaxID=445327 RepID=UPI0024B6921E|nr:hypothetical protein [Neorhodopirellula lusitana]
MLTDDSTAIAFAVIAKSADRSAASIDLSAFARDNSILSLAGGALEIIASLLAKCPSNFRELMPILLNAQALPSSG